MCHIKCHPGYRLLPALLLYHPPSLPSSTTPYPPMSSPQTRQDLVQNAVLFLQDPKTQSSPLTSKIEFLQAKGLNESEIQDALSRSSSSSTQSNQSQSIGGPSSGYGEGGYGMRYEMAPVPPKRDWRDLFVCPPSTARMYVMIDVDAVRSWLLSLEA